MAELTESLNQSCWCCCSCRWISFFRRMTRFENSAMMLISYWLTLAAAYLFIHWISLKAFIERLTRCSIVLIVFKHDILHIVICIVLRCTFVKLFPSDIFCWVWRVYSYWRTWLDHSKFANIGSISLVSFSAITWYTNGFAPQTPVQDTHMPSNWRYLSVWWHVLLSYFFRSSILGESIEVLSFRERYFQGQRKVQHSTVFTVQLPSLSKFSGEHQAVHNFCCHVVYIRVHVRYIN